ncbi:MAG: hypothetical protein KJ949_03370 [Nanoarchaeota archaeon]|nr:hypothetical protein [Nanoarchaeota archaeon]
MKKEVLIFVLVFSLMISMSFVFAEDLTADQKIDKAYDCLKNKINNTCEDLTLDQQIFSLLVLDNCKAEVKEAQDTDYCWPKDKCKTKTTAQAVLSLNEAGVNTEDAEKWLMAQNKTPTDLDWYLQIESSEATSCEVSYGSSTYTVNIAENKKIDSDAGSCLSLSSGNYWLQISPSCYSKEFEISCDQDFQTNLLYKKSDSITVYVSPETSSQSAGGDTTEKINSLCFTEGSSCNYETSLWSAWILDSKKYDISAYMPYLITNLEGNEKYLPESFLLLLGQESYQNDLLEKQKSAGYWQESSDRYFDTALALLPFYYDELPEKDKALEWLLDSQDSEGCWQGGIKNTAFILFSAWAGKAPDRDSDGNGTNSHADCEEHDYFCMYSSSCEEENILPLYDCFGSQVCCDTDIVLETCEDMYGEECDYGEECSTSEVDALDTYDCCLGTCREKQEEPEESECEQSGGTCKYPCGDSEESADYDCDDNLDYCCIELDDPDSNFLWIWILLILIVIVSVGIMFRDNLRKFWFRAKSGFGKSKPSGPRGGPGFSSSMRNPTIPRRIFPPSDEPQMRRPMMRRPSRELDDVLGKLKEMGK